MAAGKLVDDRAAGDYHSPLMVFPKALAVKSQRCGYPDGIKMISPPVCGLPKTPFANDS
jgi:hypothetical protein